MKKIYPMIVIPALTLMFGCSTMVSSLYGLNTVEEVDHDKIYSLARKYNIPLSDLYYLDYEFTEQLITPDAVESILDERIQKIGKNHLQPLQALYYSPEGNLVSYYVNCYAGGYCNLKWNRKGAMEVFPPAQQAPIDSLLPLNRHLQLLKLLPGSNKVSFDNKQHVVIVYWNQWMGRQSKRLIEQVQKNVKLAAAGSVKVLYVNTDNVYINNTASRQ